MPKSSRHQLQWDSEYVAKLMRRNKIPNREALSRRLKHVSRATVYRTFDATWSGHASQAMITQLAAHFGIPIDRLIQQVPRNHTGRPEAKTNGAGK